MNRTLGEVITGIVTDKHDDTVYVQKNGITYELDEETSYSLGDAVEGFV